MMHAAIQLTWLGFGLTSTMMALVWIWANRMKNAGIVDVFWAAGFTFLMLLYDCQGHGTLPRKILISVLVISGSLRLTSHLLKRFLKEYPQEDGRYHSMREAWGKHSEVLFFGVFQFQAILMALLSFSFAVIASNITPKIQWWEWLGASLGLIGIVGEFLADEQLKQFKNNPTNKGKTCDQGLWRYSRHPNYFFEWLVWVSYFVIALAAPGGWTTVFVPLLMLFFLTKVTGVAATEMQALKTRGNVYRRYQKTTSPFIPWFPKKEG